MKRALIVAFAVCALLAFMTGTAFATWGDSGYLAPTGSPHGGFTTTTKYCGVCHAVHNANAAGQVLLDATVANACTYCHISSFTGFIKVYNGVPGNYTTDFANNHSSVGGSTCTTCHQVHAAANDMTGQTYLDSKILKKAATYNGSYMSTPLAGDSDYVAQAKWCSGCHPYYNTAYNGSTHTMRLAGANYGNGVANTTTKVAWSPSDTCRGCHGSGQVNQLPVPPATVTVASSFPHYTGGMRFLLTATNNNGSGSADATSSQQDGVCLKCHRDGVGTAGIGVNF